MPAKPSTTPANTAHRSERTPVARLPAAPPDPPVHEQRPSPDGDHSGLRALADRRPATSFITLAIALSWLVWIPTRAAGSEAQWPMFLGAFGPAVAAAVLTRLRGGSLRTWLRAMLRFRVRARWYAVALLLPLADPAVQAVLAWQAGLPLSLGGLLERAPLYLSSFVLIMLVGGGQEELGWRGWLLPMLQRHVSPVRASLLIGVVHATWHLPLFVFGAAMYGDLVFALYLPQVVAGAVVLTWLYNSGRSSVVVAILLHTQMNVASALVPVADLSEFEDAVAAGTVSTTVLQVVLATVWVAGAAALVWHDRRLGMRTSAAGGAASSRQ